jgi:uncharacterized RmlC-like cupin family protein
MARRISPPEFIVGTGQNTDMVRAITVSAPLTGSESLYSSIVTTAPRGRTRIHHHGPCETSIFIKSGHARFTWGPTGLEHELDAVAGDFVYIPAGEIHVEENASADEPLVVLLSRNCPDSYVVYMDDGPDGSDDLPAPC